MSQAATRYLVPGLLVVLGACQSAGDYVLDRGRDVTDVLRAQVMVGKGGGIFVEATQFVGLGFMMYRGTACGLGSRTFECRDEASFTFDTAGAFVNSSETRVLEGDEPSRMHMFYLAGVIDEGRPIFSSTERGFAPWLSARVGFMVFAGFDVEVRGGEMLDLVAGLAGLDPSHDDTPADSGPRPPPSLALGVTLEPYTEVQSTWPPLARNQGRIVFLGEDYDYMGISYGHWKPRIAIDGMPVVHANGSRVYFFADAPAGQRIITANDAEVARVDVTPGAWKYVRMSVAHPDEEEEPSSNEARRRLRIEEIESNWALGELDVMRYVGEPGSAQDE